MFLYYHFLAKVILGIVDGINEVKVFPEKNG